MSPSLIPLKGQPLGQRLRGPIHPVGGLEQVSKRWPQTGCVSLWPRWPSSSRIINSWQLLLLVWRLLASHLWPSMPAHPGVEAELQRSQFPGLMSRLFRSWSSHGLGAARGGRGVTALCHGEVSHKHLPREPSGVKDSSGPIAFAGRSAKAPKP